MTTCTWCGKPFAQRPRTGGRPLEKCPECRQWSANGSHARLTWKRAPGSHLLPPEVVEARLALYAARAQRNEDLFKETP